MNLTRREFAMSGAAFAAALGLDPKAFVQETSGNPFGGNGYAALRRELKAFYPPGYCRLGCQDPAQKESSKAIRLALADYMNAHPAFDALDLRAECYRQMRRHFVPFLFPDSPFYFEAGVNGGWSGSRPARHVNEFCGRFYRQQGLIPDAAFERLWKRSGERFIVCCGPFVDDMHHVPPFHTVFTKGFAGVKADVEKSLAACPGRDVLGRKELKTALEGLETVRAIQLAFAAKAAEELKRPGLSEKTRRYYARIAETAKRCPWEPPRTFYEGLNTLWFVREILGYVDGVNQFSLGRPDAWLIDAYRTDLAAGRLTTAEARDLVAEFLITADCHEADGAKVSSYDDQEAEIPLTLGGCDREGRPLYNELTEMFLDAHLGLDLVYPKLHCRISRTSPSAYLRKIGAMLMSGHAVFALFNDDRHVPQFERLGIRSERARDYVGTGCWDGNVDSVADVDCANYVSVGRILELTIHRDEKVEREAGVVIDPIDGAKSFEEVRDTIYRNFIRFFRSVLSDYTRYGRANAKVFPHPVYSMCLEGPLRTRRDTTDGGVDFRPREVTLAFLANTVDSLCAIRRVCFERKAATLAEFLAAVRANWAVADGERLRQEALASPYWGDGSEASNVLMKWWIDAVADDLEGFANDQGGPYVLATWIYREFRYWGERMKATPDGRHDGDRLAQGFSPSEFRCTAGATTVLNAIGSLDHTRLYASNANLAFEKSVMSPEMFEAVFRVICRKDLHLLQPNCLSVEELRDAQVHPELHRNIIVKVCGFSARFVSLDRKWQDEVIHRHLLK